VCYAGEVSSLAVLLLVWYAVSGNMHGRRQGQSALWLSVRHGGEFGDQLRSCHEMARGRAAELGTLNAEVIAQ
jgi:hypothetical protein